MPTPAIIATFINAVNAGDTDAFLALFDERGVVNDWGSRYVGRDEIRAWSERDFIGVQATLDVTSSEQHGNKASVVARVGGHGFYGSSRFSFTMAGALVKEMRMTGA
jgi:hypothetical protein